MLVECDFVVVVVEYAPFMEEEKQLCNRPNQKNLGWFLAFIKVFKLVFKQTSLSEKFAERCSVYVADGLNVPEPELTRWLLSSRSLSL